MRPPGAPDPKATLFPNMRRVLAATAPIVPLHAVSWESVVAVVWLCVVGSARGRCRGHPTHVPEAGDAPRSPFSPLSSSPTQPTDGSDGAWFSLADLW